nr:MULTISPECIES: hypothetical protein [unclassified Frankia]
MVRKALGERAYRRLSDTVVLVLDGAASAASSSSIAAAGSRQ